MDIATNPEPEAIIEAGTAGFQIWCTPADHPKGWDGVVMTCIASNALAFSKSCEYVASIGWGLEGETITHLLLSTAAYALVSDKHTHNRPADLVWAKRKIRWLFKQSGVTCPEIRIER